MALTCKFDLTMVGADREPSWAASLPAKRSARGRSTRSLAVIVRRIVAAFVTVPLIPAILFGVTMGIWGLASSWGIDPPTTYFASIPIWAMFALPVSYASAVLLGVPAFL